MRRYSEALKADVMHLMSPPMRSLRRKVLSGAGLLLLRNPTGGRSGACRE